MFKAGKLNPKPAFTGGGFFIYQVPVQEGARHTRLSIQLRRDNARRCSFKCHRLYLE
jgi:hypothetical protein